MKTKLFADTDLTPEAIRETLESENCGVEEKDFVKPFTDEELEAVENEYLEDSKELALLRRKLEEVSGPIKEQMKPLQKNAAININRINKGGE